MSLRSSLRIEGISMRSIFMFVITALSAALLLALYNSPSANAAEATWDGASLRYENRQYLSAGTSNGTDSHRIPKDSEYYISVEGEAETDSDASRQSKNRKAHVIYFAPGVSPPESSNASYLTYTYDTSTKEFSSPSQTQGIVIDTETSQSSGSSCTIEGVGWIVCSVSNWLAKGMDLVFDLLDGFMEVPAINVGNSESGLYKAWDIMRNIANIAFIAVFIIIIYSQLTGFGMSNYGLKKTLPRLVIAAILVNLSFIISALAIDISNILGYSLQDILINIRGQFFGSEIGVAGKMWTWESITALVLSGGTAVAATGVGIASVVASSGGTLAAVGYMLVPILIGLISVLLVVLLVLAARQAIIIILVIISPLAFVAYLLPNTEKWFEKWRGLFMTMLIFFPAFSLVFGGSQLAGAAIIDSAGNITTVILGMAVQIAPLVITPFLLKFSGNLLGRIAGMVNNPNKGLIDRSRKWSDEQREMHRQRGISGAKFNGEAGQLRRRNVLKNAARRAEDRRRKLKDRTGNYSSRYDNSYHDSKAYSKLHEQAHDIEMDKEIIDNKHKEHLNHAKSKDNGLNADGTVKTGKLYAKNIALEQGKRAVERSQSVMENDIMNLQNDKSSSLHLANVEAARAKGRLDLSTAQSQRVAEEYKSGKISIDPKEAGLNSEKLKEIAEKMADDQKITYAETRATVAAKQAGQTNYAKTIEVDVALQKRAGGVDPNGAQKALAEALTVISKNKKENIENIKTIISYKNLTDDEKKELIKGGDIKEIKASTEARAAAIESMLEGASPNVIGKLIKEFDFSTEADDDKRMLYGTMAKSLEGSKLRPAFFDFGRIASLKQSVHSEKRTYIDANGNEVEENIPITGPYGETGVNSMIMDVIGKQTLTVESMQSMFTPYVNMIRDAVQAQDPKSLSDKEKKGLTELKNRVGRVLDPAREGYDKLGDSKLVYEEIQDLLNKLV